MFKRFFMLVLCATLINLCFSMPMLAETNNKSSLSVKEAVIVIDYSSGETIFAQNQDVPLAPASITKLMTAMLCLEKGRLSDTVTVGSEISGLEGSLLGLVPGDRITVENLLYGLLVQSGNDAANALAVYTNGSLDSFTAAMNSKARSLGMVNTNFVNPHGLPAPNHVSSARDISILARNALQNREIQTVVATKERMIQWQHKDGRAVQLQLKNTNKLLDVYPGVSGMKTGSTVEAGQCLATFAQWDEGKIIVVLLNSANRYQDSAYWLDRTFQTKQFSEAGNVLLQSSWLGF